MRFWDASAVVPLCVHEDSTSEVVDRLAAESMAVWWATPVEAASALARLRRMGQLTELEEQAARQLLVAWQAVWTELLPTDVLRRRALRLLGVHDLRAADALQLAAALAWAGSTPEGAEFVCLDERLARAARREGFRVLPTAEPGPGATRISMPDPSPREPEAP